MIMSRLLLLNAILALVSFTLAGPFDAALRSRQSTGGSSSNLTVDLGYEIYQGYLNSTSGLNIWKG